MADMAAPLPGQFDAQAPGVTAASGIASDSLEGDLHSLEQQLADLQVLKWCSWHTTACSSLAKLKGHALYRSNTMFCSELFADTAWNFILCWCPQVKVQQKRAEADSVAPYSRSFNRTLVGTLFSASRGLGLVLHIWMIM